MNTALLSKFCLFLVVFVTAFHDSDAGCPSKEWTQYKEEKCVRIFNLLASHRNSVLFCQEQNAGLLSIASAEEQEFIDQRLLPELGTVDNVWLGAVRVNSTTFEWMDGSSWTYDNWKEGSPSDVEGNDCVQMVSQGGRQYNFNTFDPSPSNLWSDTICETRNLVVCQKRFTFSLNELTALFLLHRQTSEAVITELELKLAEADRKLGDLGTKQATVEAELEVTRSQLKVAEKERAKLGESINDLENNPVPLGFVYTQLSGQPEPSVIWPTVIWTQVTKEYAGLFFRAEGGNSSIFGEVQEDESPRLSRVVMSQRTDGFNLPREIDVPERGASDSIYTSSDSVPPVEQLYWSHFLSFHNSGGEVRPKNQAIRLWKRTA